MSTALATIISDIKLQDAAVVRAQLLSRIKIAKEWRSQEGSWRRF